MTASWALVTDVDLEAVNVHLETLEEAGLLGLVEEHGRVTAYFPTPCDGLPVAGRWERVPDRDWNAAWKAGIEPVTVGTITVTPPWIPVAGALVIEPARAFGTGHHETTTACLAGLQELPVRGSTVLDVGTGTGVLALAARRLGARRVVACDVDPVATETARCNAAANALDVEVRDGSVETADGVFDIVLANLDTATLSRLAGDLAGVLGPHGHLVASGVGNTRAGEARDALTGAGLDVEVRPGDEWTLLVARRPSSPVTISRDAS